MKGKRGKLIFFFHQLIYFQHLNQFDSWNKISGWIAFIKTCRVHFNNVVHSQITTIFILTFLSRGKSCSWIAKPRRKQNKRKIYYVGCLLSAFLIWNRLSHLRKLLGGQKILQEEADRYTLILLDIIAVKID